MKAELKQVRAQDLGQDLQDIYNSVLIHILFRLPHH
jgi:hypothetical protein